MTVRYELVRTFTVQPTWCLTPRATDVAWPTRLSNEQTEEQRIYKDRPFWLFLVRWTLVVLPGAVGVSSGSYKYLQLRLVWTCLEHEAGTCKRPGYVLRFS